ncbi:RcnB family protein [Limibaculum sp. M0105]|uniref:RcnB family protein n=1 Tax=Thermohalobaculum xanthum TaxID=2753746 RepID=A0A8J7M7J8_9RHOB|nr:RcnB family protein [Thermohalobaculum xanthum]MBK0400046.1 RcnB family protein [Thermohalobaculum xanthum]
MRQTLLAAVAAAFLLPAFAGIASADPAHCPPGHAKKGWCSPGPKYYYRRGDRIPRDRYIVIEDYDRYGYRRPPSGYGYVRVDSDIFLIALGTGLIVEALR